MTKVMTMMTISIFYAMNNCCVDILNSFVASPRDVASLPDRAACAACSCCVADSDLDLDLDCD